MSQQKTTEPTTSAIEFLGALLDTDKSVLAVDRESYRKAYGQLVSRLYRGPNDSDGYNFRHVAEVCSGSAAVIKALHALLSHEAAPDWLKTRTYTNTRQDKVLTVSMPYSPRHCRCALTVANQQFSPWGTRQLQAVSVVAQETEIGLIASLLMHFKTPPMLEQTLYDAIESFFCTDINPIGSIQPYVMYARYVPGSFLQQQLGARVNPLQQVSTGVLRNDDPRTGLGEVDAFMASSLPTIAAYLKRLTLHNDDCHNHASRKDEDH